MAKKVESEVWMDVPGMAQYACIGIKMAYRLIQSGSIPSYKLSPRKTIVKRSDVDAYIEKHQQ